MEVTIVIATNSHGAMQPFAFFNQEAAEAFGDALNESGGDLHMVSMYPRESVLTVGKAEQLAAEVSELKNWRPQG
jgi:hypothetical protein